MRDPGNEVDLLHGLVPKDRYGPVTVDSYKLHMAFFGLSTSILHVPKGFIIVSFYIVSRFLVGVSPFLS